MIARERPLGSLFSRKRLSGGKSAAFLIRRSLSIGGSYPKADFDADGDGEKVSERRAEATRYHGPDERE